jgi:hypothetical protein
LSVVSTLAVLFTLNTVEALRLRTVTTDLAASASENISIRRLDLEVEMVRTIGDMPRTPALVGDLEWFVAGPARGQFAVYLCAAFGFD